MRLQDDILARYGVDKVLHFLVGALITALASVAGLLYFKAAGMIAGALFSIPAVLVLSYYKEKRLDDRYDALDIKAAMYGSGAVAVLVVFMFGVYAVMHDL